MNKIISLLLVIFISVSAHAQQDADTTHAHKGNFYLKAGVGYAFPQTTTISYENYPSFKDKRGDYTTGLNETIGGGYMFNKYLGVELNVNMYSGNNKFSSGYSGGLSENLSYNDQLIALLAPGIVLQNSFRKITLYSRLSLVLPAIDKTSYNDDVSAGGRALNSSEHDKVKNMVTPGFSGAIGVKYNITSLIDIWAECSYLSLAPFTKSITNTQGSVTEYAKSGSSINNSPLPNQTYTNPYNNIGLQAGIFVVLGNRILSNELHETANCHFYFKAGIGYAIAMPDVNGIGYSSNFSANLSTNVQSETYRVKTASFSSGLNGILGAGYMFSKHVGTELDGDFIVASKKYYNIESFTQTVGGPTNYGYVKQTAQAKLPILALPCLLLQTDGKPVNIYCRIGIAMPLSNKLSINGYSIGNPNGNTQIETQSTQITTNYTIGYSGAAGIQYMLTRHLAIWGEISVLSFTPDVKEEKTSGSISGLAQIPDIIFKHSGTIQFIQGMSGTVIEPTYQLPYSNAGLQAGISFRL